MSRGARIGHSTSEETRKKISQTLTGHLVSDETRKKCSVKLKGRVRSEEANNKASLTRRLRNGSPEYKHWSNDTKKFEKWHTAVLVRDNYTCQRCGITKEKWKENRIKLRRKVTGLCVHHLKECENFPELGFDVSNGITCCPHCHPFLEVGILELIPDPAPIPRRVHLPHRLTNTGRVISAKKTGKPRPDVSKRNKERNPINYPGAKEKMRQTKLAWNIDVPKDPRQSQEYYTWEESVKKRDNYLCQLCGISDEQHRSKSPTKRRLSAHHVKSWRDFPEIRFSIDNGLTVCDTCHIEIEGGKFHRRVVNYRKQLYDNTSPTPKDVV